MHGVWQSDAPVTVLPLGKPVPVADNEGRSRVAKLIFVSNDVAIVSPCASVIFPHALF